jgi:hypothetical protein
MAALQGVPVFWRQVSGVPLPQNPSKQGPGGQSWAGARRGLSFEERVQGHRAIER